MGLTNFGIIGKILFFITLMNELEDGR